MNDPKAAFYFRHRAAIEEWAGLRIPARAAFSEGLASALTVFGPDEVADASSFDDQHGGWRKIGLTSPQWAALGWPLAVVLGWNESTILDPSKHEFPFIGVFLTNGEEDRRDLSKVIAGALKDDARQLHWKGQQEDAYPVWTHVPQPTADLSMSAWVGACHQALRTAWQELSPAISQFVRSAPRPMGPRPAPLASL